MPTGGTSSAPRAVKLDALSDLQRSVATLESSYAKVRAALDDEEAALGRALVSADATPVRD